MKKLFLLLAAFTCMSTYTGQNGNNNNNSGIGFALAIGGVIVTYYTGKWVYNKYWNTPASNIPQQANTSITNTNAPQKEEAKNTQAPQASNPVTQDFNKKQESSPAKEEIKNIPTPSTQQSDSRYPNLEKHMPHLHEVFHYKAPIQEQPKNTNNTPTNPVMKKMEEKKETPWHHNEKLINMMYDI